MKDTLLCFSALLLCARALSSDKAELNVFDVPDQLSVEQKVRGGADTRWSEVSIAEDLQMHWSPSSLVQAEPSALKSNSSTAGLKEPEDPDVKKRIAILDVKVDTEASKFSQITLNVQTNATGTIDVFCRAYTKPREHIPQATVGFMSCWKCFTGMTQQCQDQCDVVIHGLEGNRNYHVWCVPKFQPDLGQWFPANEDIFPQDTNGVPWKTTRVDPAKVHKITGVENFFATILVVLYVFWSFNTRGENSMVHSSVPVLILGLLLGALVKYFFNRQIDFSYNLFSYHLLPMVIFSAGFRLKGNEMIKRLVHIGLLGSIGTIINLFMLFMVAGAVTNFQSRERVILASALCATDTIAAISYVPQSMMPVAHSIVLGEGILNDIMSVLIFSTLGTHLHDVNKLSVWVFTLKFGYFFISSIICGFVFGFLIIQLLRACDIVQKDTLRVVTTIMMMNFCCYAFAECSGVSSILALFVSAIITGRYAWHELARDTQRLCNDLADMVGMLADAMVYGHLGLSSWSYIESLTSIADMALPVLCFTLVMFGMRALTVTGVNSAMSLGGVASNRDQSNLNFQDAGLVTLGGAMRGSIAYALVLKAVPPDDLRTEGDISLISMTNKIIIFNCIFFGVLVPAGVRYLTVGKGSGIPPGAMSPMFSSKEPLSIPETTKV